MTSSFYFCVCIPLFCSVFVLILRRGFAPSTSHRSARFETLLTRRSVTAATLKDGRTGSTYRCRLVLGCFKSALQKEACSRVHVEQHILIAECKKSGEPPKVRQRLNVILSTSQSELMILQGQSPKKLIHSRGLRALPVCQSKQTLCFSTTASCLSVFSPTFSCNQTFQD